MYVPEVYKPLHDRISKAPNNDVVTGTPGIGKSYFAVYELYLVVKAGNNVVYQRHTEHGAFSLMRGMLLYSMKTSGV